MSRSKSRAWAAAMSAARRFGCARVCRGDGFIACGRTDAEAERKHERLVRLRDGDTGASR